MPISTRQRGFFAKVEGTVGTPETLNAATGVMIIEEMGRDPQTPFTQRLAANGYGRKKGVPGARMGTMNAMLYMHGNGATGLPYWADLLKGCGGAFTSQVFAPVAGTTTTLTTGIQRGSGATAELQSMAGVMGNAVMTFIYGQICPIRFAFTGKVYVPATQTFPTVTDPTTTSPRFAGATFTIGGTTYQIDQLEFDFGNQIMMRPDPTDTSGSGYVAAWISDAIPKVRISVEALPLATKDWDDAFYNSTTAALNLVLGSASNNIITLAAPVLQLTAPPGDGDRNGVFTKVLEFQCLQNGDTENSEWTLTFS